jgi:hypothetical protein
LSLAAELPAIALVSHRAFSLKWDSKLEADSANGGQPNSYSRHYLLDVRLPQPLLNARGRVRDSSG